MSRILIIEDEEAIADLEKDYLELSDFDVTIEHDGEEGLKQALSGDYGLIILDLMLPGMDGFEVCKHIREKKDVPVIMVSAKKDDIDKIRGLGLGADDYLTKPFSPSELVARVKAHLSRYSRLVGNNAKKNDIIEIRELKIDKTARRVFIDGVEKPFTTKEFDLLTFLAENPNHVFSKEELFRQIWNMESVGDIATVTVHIKKIREKIEYDTSNPQYIETIWGVGYRFKI
ncbi:MAG: response regulator transcription factor [Lachnospiraceae bacterium]|nr:response regulator transcription factor [Lachnospiraceae bacterium]MBF0996552.1 response regulator transcription factor [Lachnospiraceae bacterium]MBF0998908.1 response regulator transcription factor [Lachnospiraceae bacterium]MBF1002132.1 response regulator transcription factor [Lachnospiraceae bacterium]MBF1007977.1 response regulator transcription factor [Lachnospiraceae bacterium]